MDCFQYMNQNGKDFFSWKQKTSSHLLEPEGDYSKIQIDPFCPWDSMNPSRSIGHEDFGKTNKKLEYLDCEFARSMLLRKLNSGYYEKYRRKIISILVCLNRGLR